MKQFLKYLLVTFSGTFLGLVFFVLIFGGIFIGIIASSTSSQVEVKESSVLIIRLKEQIAELSSFNPLSEIVPSQSEGSVLGLRDILFAIEKAGSDPKIKGIVLYMDAIQAGYSSTFEIQSQLQEFKKSGKFIYSYADIYSQKSYLLASVSDKVFMNPEGMFELTGISSHFISYKNLLEKIGLQPVIFRAGKYKSYVESVSRETMSPENREQVQSYIHAIWNSYTESISENRINITKPIKNIADSLLIWHPTDAFSYKLVDSLVYYDEFLSIVKQKLNKQESDKINFISLAQYIQHNNESAKITLKETPANIAVIVASGNITMGKGDNKSIGGETLSSQIRQARTDSTIQAVVLRINSGGGSALASEAIWREVKRCADTKPTIVSMGDLAASGAYYIAAPAHTIVAQPTSLTGSIGVFGLLVNSEQLLQKIGVRIDTVKTNSYADIGSPNRQVSDYETMIISKSIDKTYDVFKQRVQEGRNLSASQVEAIAQGRIWSGKDAQNIGLVDTLGGMKLAIQIAAEKAGIANNFTIKHIPEQKSTMEMLVEMLSGKQSMIKEISSIIGTDAQHIYEIMQETPFEKGTYMQIPFMLRIQ